MKKINLLVLSTFISVPAIAETMTQNFDDFENGRSWYVSDFGVQDLEKNVSTVENGEIKFKVKWTKRSRNHLADRLGFDREDMTQEKAAEICPPVLEFGRANVYRVGPSSNMIAELDSDLSQCGIHGSEPGNVALKAKVPTIPGHYYKVDFKYVMRKYGNMPANAYKNLVARFGSEMEKFNPNFDNFKDESLTVLARKNLTRLVFRDNGLPDSYGILMDDIKVDHVGVHPNAEECSSRYRAGSNLFNACIDGEIDLGENCDSFNTAKYRKEGLGLTVSRSNLANVFTNEPATAGRINFTSLGLGGILDISCRYEGSKRNVPVDVFGKTLNLREITWGNNTVTNYPESAEVRARLQGCTDESMNGFIDIATVVTGQEFSYKFETTENGQSFEGCKIKKLVIKDTTPQGPSSDGFDINSVSITD